MFLTGDVVFGILNKGHVVNSAHLKMPLTQRRHLIRTSQQYYEFLTIKLFSQQIKSLRFCYSRF